VFWQSANTSKFSMSNRIVLLEVIEVTVTSFTLLVCQSHRVKVQGHV
jgi:hypothetical protein